MEENILYTTESQPINEKPKRPQLLTVLCILSFIFTGIAIVILLIGIFGVIAAKNAGIDLTQKMAEMGTDQVSVDAAASALSLPSLITSLALSVIGLFAVIMMWKLNKKGFFLYSGVQVVSIIMPIIFSGMVGLSVFSLVISALFIVLFGMNLKHMK